MLVPIAIQTQWYRIKLWKVLPTAVILTIVGTFGTYIWFFIENHWIGGTSFYGAVFVVPVIFSGVAKLLHIPYAELMDICAPAECAMLMVMKIQCQISGCCGGKPIFTFADGSVFYFPSQIAEFVNAFVILIVLMILSRDPKQQGTLYPWYMMIYGITRFVLNHLREKSSTFALGLTAGAFWSIWSVVLGFLWLRMINKYRQKTDMGGGTPQCTETENDGMLSG